MGRNRWTTPDELKFLTERIPQYRTARRERRLPDFQEETIAAFFQKDFPFDPTTPANAEALRTCPGGRVVLIRTVCIPAMSVRAEQLIQRLLSGSFNGIRITGATI